jgi:hypothetical protein
MAKPRRPLVLGGRVVDGVLHLDNRQQFEAAVKHADWQRRVTVTVEPEEQVRSQRANRYLFGVIYRDAVIAFHERGDLNMSKLRLHAIMKEHHNWEDIIDPFTGEIMRRGADTKGLPVEAFGVFIEKVMQELSEYLGIVFDEPRRHEDWREKAAA